MITHECCGWSIRTDASQPTFTRRPPPPPMQPHNDYADARDRPVMQVPELYSKLGWVLQVRGNIIEAYKVARKGMQVSRTVARSVPRRRVSRWVVCFIRSRWSESRRPMATRPTRRLPASWS